jgi:uncharacterized protein GlcG (DUF336 family)
MPSEVECLCLSIRYPEKTMTLLLAQANEIIASAFRRAAAAGYKPMSVVVVDDAGHVKSSQRQDGASMFRIDIASGKAWAAVAMGASSRVLKQRAEEMPAFFNALASAGDGKFIPQTGAVLIKNSVGVVIGAVGASGGTGDEDEEVCIAGVSAAGLSAG